MAEQEGLPQEDLYQKWYEWVITHLGHDSKFATAAATEAANASHQGKGFNAHDDNLPALPHASSNDPPRTRSKTFLDRFSYLAVPKESRKCVD